MSENQWILLSSLSQAEREEHQMMIDEKQSRALLKNTFDPLLSQITKVTAMKRSLVLVRRSEDYSTCVCEKRHVYRFIVYD